MEKKVKIRKILSYEITVLIHWAYRQLTQSANYLGIPAHETVGLDIYMKKKKKKKKKKNRKKKKKKNRKSQNKKNSEL